MAMRSRTPTFRAQPSVQRVYETLQPQSEMKQSPEAYLLHVYLPGYTKERIKITYVSSSQRVEISGERPILGNRWSRFDQTYLLPENCEAEKLQGKFEFGTLILTMPKKKTISEVSPKQEVKTTQEKDQPGSSDKVVPEKAKPEKAQEAIPPQYTTPKVDEPIGDKKNASLSSPVKGSPEKAKPEKAQETIPPQYTTAKVVEEPIRDKTSASLPSPEDAEKERVSKKEVKEDGKPYHMEKAIIKEKDTRASEVSPKELAEPSGLKAPEKSKEDMIDTVGIIGIRELAVSTCQVVTRIAEGKLNEEEKHLVVNMGAAALVIAALGAYVSYRFASSG